jgi:hypothetical protein
MFHAQFTMHVPHLEEGKTFLCGQATDIFLSSSAAEWQNNTWCMTNSMKHVTLIHSAVISQKMPIAIMMYHTDMSEHIDHFSVPRDVFLASLAVATGLGVQGCRPIHRPHHAEP